MSSIYGPEGAAAMRPPNAFRATAYNQVRGRWPPPWGRTFHHTPRSACVSDPVVVVCVFEDGATGGRRNVVAAGKSDLVRFQRDAVQRAIGPQLVAAVERLTSRTVHTFLSGTDQDGGSSIEAFLLEPEQATDQATLQGPEISSP
jgi:hypothetical protein